MTELQKKMFEEMGDESLFSDMLAYGTDYIEGAFARHVYPTDEAIKNLDYFDEELPIGTSNAKEIIQNLHHYGSPATVSQIGGRYFGFVNGSVVPAGLVAKLLASFWDQNTAMYVLSPLAGKLEKIVESWLVSLFQLPKHSVAGFVSGTSMANLCGLAAARYRLLQNQHWDINQKGLMQAPPIRIIASLEAHSTVIKTLGLLGYGRENIEWIETDNQGRIQADLIPPLDHTTLVILAAGNVHSGSFDDFSKIGKMARAAGAWVHVDGAFGLWARAVQKISHLADGIEYANSWAVDGHKTLNTPYDCGIILCDDREALTSALHMAGGYLVLNEDRDGMFYTPEMSRRARIIELWATLKFLGRSGIDSMISEMHERAKQFATALSAIDGFYIMNDVVFNQVIVRCKTDEITNQVLKEIQRDRVCWVGGSVWKNKAVIRISVCSWATTAEDVDLSVKSFQKAINEVAHRSVSDCN